MDCRCTTVTELYGDEAAAYAADHLSPAGDADALACPDTGTLWKLDDRDPEQPRLVAQG